MQTSAAGPRDVNEYIAGFPKDVQRILRKIRLTIHKAAPGAEETISYKMPSFRLNGYLVHFAAYTNHIGMYPAPVGVKEFKKELSRYQASKSTLRFPLDKPIPLTFIRRLVKFRARENLARAKAGGKKR
jgi:uncharacterized protein YdhG (YjbR/CyaY superfamily)